MTKNLAVVGSPISHSKSPTIHAAAYRVLGKDFAYNKIEISKNHLMQFTDTLDDSWIGLSVTAPLKVEALRLAAESDDTSKLTNSANTLVRVDSTWHAYNTDVFGMQKALSEANLADAKSISILGAGATALSAVVAASRNYPNAVIQIAARNRNAASDLAKFANGISNQKSRTVSFSKALTSADLIISTLPARALDQAIGKISKSWIRKPAGALFDVAYEPWPSAAAQLWNSKNLPVISGIEMLLWQALAQVRIFCEGDPNLEVFNEPAVMHAMRNSIGLI